MKTFSVPTILTLLLVFSFLTAHPLVFPRNARTLGSSSPSLSLNKSSINFGGVRQNSSKSDTLKITNSSSDTLRIDSITVKTSTYLLNLKNGFVTNTDTLRMIVTFTPPAFGTHTDTVLIYNNSQTPIVKVPLTGTSSGSMITSFRPFVDFGLVKLAQQSTVRFGIINKSPNIAVIDSAKHLDSAFKIVFTSKFPASIGTYDLRFGGDSLGLIVTFKPDSIRPYADTIYIYSQTITPLMKIPLTGTGASPLTVSDKQEIIPKEMLLAQNYPNPFNPSTTIQYSIPADLSGFTVVMKIFDLLGNEVATLLNRPQSSGNYSVQFNAALLPSGMYFYRLHAGPFVVVKRMMVLK